MQLLIVENARRRVGRVTLGTDALVPIVIGIGGVLKLDSFKGRILPRWLIEMSVNTDVSCGRHLVTLPLSR